MWIRVVDSSRCHSTNLSKDFWRRHDDTTAKSVVPTDVSDLYSTQQAYPEMGSWTDVQATTSGGRLGKDEELDIEDSLSILFQTRKD